MNPSTLRINAERFKTNFEALSKIGATPDGGVHRPTFSQAHLQVRAWFRELAAEAGLEFNIDSAGNHSALLQCADPEAPTLLLGSHLDSVTNGGRFDGAIGVLSALEVLQTIKDAGLYLPIHLEAIDFTDEEGTLFGLMGSAAVAGKLTPQDLLGLRGGRNALLSGLSRAGLTEEGLLMAKRQSHQTLGYLEVHIEQGSRLIEAGADIGLVTSIVGTNSYRLTFLGRADHAGTTPMDARLDAGQGASAFTLAARQQVMRNYPQCVVNIGSMTLEPGAFNIVPERACLSLEFRAHDEDTLDQLERALLELAEKEAQRFNLGLDIESVGAHQPALMSQQIQDVFHRAAKSLNLKTVPLASFAGHDAQSMASICPAGMIFIPSVDGASHSPREYTEWQDCVNGASVLLHAVLSMAIG